jgi:hypothetical protein
MLVVKPNLRRMRYMRDSPSEKSVHIARDRRRVYGLGWERVFLAGVAVAIVLGLAAVAAHY